MPSGYIQIWQIMLTNVGEVPLKKINLKPASGWSPGLARPIQVTIRVGSEPNKIVPITDENWRVGIALNTEVPIGQTATIQLVANGVASHIVANGQFDESDVYQFDFSFDQIKLEIPANQGRKDQAYQAMVTWNLVTGP